MIVLKNFWVQKRYQRVHDNAWMLFLWGFPALSMLNALEQASKKTHPCFDIEEKSPKEWHAIDKESNTRYIVEMRDDKPAIPDGENTSVRDQTLPVSPERKRMPVAGSLFNKQQPELF